MTKTDLPNAAPEDTALIMATTFKLDPSDVILTSAKKNLNILSVFEAIVDRLPCPTLLQSSSSSSSSSSSPSSSVSSSESYFLARIVDSWFDEHRGVICLAQLVSGSLKEGQRISILSACSPSSEEGENSHMNGQNNMKTDFSVQEVGILTPTALRTNSLRVGQVGYIISGR